MPLTEDEEFELLQLEREKFMQPQPSQDVQVAPAQDFFQRTVPSLMERAGRMGQSIGRTGGVFYGQGDRPQGIPETAFQMGGEALMGAGDVLGNLAISGYRELPESVRGGLESAGGTVLGALGQFPSATGGTLGEKLPQELDMLSRQFQDLEAQDPRSAANLRALGALATSRIPAGVVGTTARGGAAVMKGAPSVVKKIIPQPKTVPLSEVEAAARAAYKQADQFGGVLKKTVSNRLLNDVLMKIDEKGGTLPKAAKTALRKTADPEGKVRQATQIFEGLKDKHLTLEGFRAIDQTLGDIAYASSTPDDVSRKILIMQRSLRDTVENAKPTDMIGGSEGFEAYKAARALWSKKARIEDLEFITRKAFATDQPASSLRRALKRFLADEKNLRGFSAAEIKAIKDTADTGVGKELMRMLSGRLAQSVSMGTGNVALAPVLATASMGARNLADDMALRKMSDITTLIASGQAPQRTAMQTLGNIAGGAASGAGSALGAAYNPALGRLATYEVYEQNRPKSRVFK